MKVGCIKKVLPHRAKGEYLTERCEIGEFFFIFTFLLCMHAKSLFWERGKGGKGGSGGRVLYL